MPTDAKDRRTIYQERKNQGYCPRCGVKVKKTSKFIYCEDCRAFFRNYFKGIADNTNEARKSRYAERKENHQCPRCGKKLGKRYKKTICETCLDKQYNYR